MEEGNTQQKTMQTHLFLHLKYIISGESIALVPFTLKKITTEIHFSDVPPLWLHNMSKIQE